MAAFADMLANGGVSAAGERLLGRESIELMRQDHLSSAQRASMLRDWPMLADYSYGLGVRVFKENADGCGGAAGEFGWEGAAGSYMLIDPDRRISCFYAQHVRDCEWACYHVHRSIRACIYEALQKKDAV